jgi:hypothetical protein
MFHRSIVVALSGAVLAISAVASVGCTDDTGSTNNNVAAFNPGAGGPAAGPSASASGGASSGGPTTEGGCSNKPANCFCGTPTTQQQWLNRCTNASALPVTLAVKPATTADIP